jgi:hypothetical protein
MGVTAFIVGSIAFGILASQVIEIPAIRLRDRLFPSSSASHPAELGSDNKQAILETPPFGVMRAPDIDQLN